MELENYNVGAGLNKKVYIELVKILDTICNKQDVVRVLEFGSGMSTKFFIDYNNKNKTDKDILNITSFDNDLKWCYKKSPEDTCLNLFIRPLVECNEIDFNIQMKDKLFNPDVFSLRKTAPTWRQRNCFYNIDSNDIVGEYDIIVIDGPNGNGRNISYLHFMKNVKPGTIIVLDDHNSHDNNFNYNFIKYFNHFFKSEEIYRHESTLQGNFKEGGNFVFFKII
jgi:hypothetical protein